jgi:hypothetical protein
VESVCPGCALRMPQRAALTHHGYYNASPECWSVYTEVLEAEYSNAALFGRVHQLTVDTYAVHHAGGPHPDKSVDVHLAGLHFVIEQGLAPTSVPPRLQQLATKIKTWPHFEPPPMPESITVFDVAMAGSVEEHVARVREWSAAVWAAWGPHHAAVAEMCA